MKQDGKKLGRRKGIGRSGWGLGGIEARASCRGSLLQRDERGLHRVHKTRRVHRLKLK